jgi:histone deacetylase 1/2
VLPLPPLRIESSSPTNKHSFSAIYEKLDSDNYLLQCQQVELVIKAHKLHPFLINPSIPIKYHIVDDADANYTTPAYEAWEQHEQILLVWLQSTVSREILTLIIGCKSSWILRDKIHAYFQHQTNAKLCQLRSEHHNMRLVINCKNSVSDFLLCIQNLIGSINAIGEPISVRKHLDIILEGLPQDFESTVNLSDSIEEVDTLLLCQKACLDRFCKQMLFAATENLIVSLRGVQFNSNIHVLGLLSSS